VTAVPTILLIDDDEYVVEALGELLDRKGYRVAIAGDGQQALEYLRTNLLPSLILLDLMMPRMDGWEFLNQRARHEHLSSIPVVITSAAETNEGMNVAAIVRKPWNIEDLLKVINEHTLET
jgi:CheY-like chemotaxis protein